MATTAPPDVPVLSLQDIHAETKARANIAVIADELDLEYRRIVPGVELRRFARDNGADLRDDKIKSFVASDIMAEARDAEGNTTYLAVEASYTGDLHDADRARNHAALMQRLTNKPCRAVIASARNNDRVLELIDSGEVAWHQLQVRIQLSETAIEPTGRRQVLQARKHGRFRDPSEGRSLDLPVWIRALGQAVVAIGIILTGSRGYCHAESELLSQRSRRAAKSIRRRSPVLIRE